MNKNLDHVGSMLTIETWFQVSVPLKKG